MIIPEFKRNTKKLLRTLYESEGRTIMVTARNLLTKAEYEKIQNFRKCHSFTFTQALLHILSNLTKMPKCKNSNCTNEVTFRRKDNQKEYRYYCSTKCSNTDETTKQKARQTNLRNFGFENASQAPEIKQKKIETCLENHGVEHPMQSSRVRRKSRKTVQKHYGVDNISQSKQVLKAKKKTWIAKYGYDNPSKAPEIKKLISQKVHSSMTKRKIINGQGRKQYILQGYEPQALKYIRKFFKYKNVHGQNSGKVPSFEYYFDGRERTYFPDFYIDINNCIVEVKSLYTFCRTSSTFRMIKAKCKAVKAEGYKFKLLLMQSDGTRIKVPSDWYTLTYKQLKAALPPNRFL